MKQRRPEFLRSKWFAGVLCLLTYLGGGSGLLAEVCSLAAAFDRSHRPIVSIQQEAFVLVLGHSNKAGSPAAASHRHGAIAQVLCVLANQNSAQSDHRLEFSPCAVSEKLQNYPGLSVFTASWPPAVVFSTRVNVAAVSDLFLPGGRNRFALLGSLLSTDVTVLLV